MISVEELAPNTYLVRHHPKGGWGDTYDGTCIVQMLSGICSVKGLSGQMGHNGVADIIRGMKEHFGVDKLHFERQRDLTKKKVI